MDRDKLDLWFLVGSRGTRSFAGGILSVIISLYYKSVFTSLTLVGILLGAGAIGVPLISFATGRYADKYGRKKLLLLTIALLPAALIMLLVTANFYALILSAALGGFGIAGGLVGGGVGAAVVPMQSALLAEKTNAGNRTLVFSLFTVMSSITGSVGAIASNLGDFHSLFVIALAFSAFSLIFAIPIKENFRPKNRVVPTDAGKEGSGELSGPKEVVKPLKSGRDKNENRTTIRKFIITGAINGASQGLIIQFLPLILHYQMHLGQGPIGDLFAVGGFSSALFMLAAPYMTEKLGFVRFIVYSRALSAAFMIYFPFATSAILASIAYVIFTIFRAIALPTQSSLMMNLVDEETRANASGSNQAARLIPSACAAPVSGVIQDFLGYIIPFEIAFLLSSLNIYLYLKFFGKVAGANRHEIIVHEG